MTSEFNALLPTQQGDKPQIWIIGTREQVVHIMNELYVKEVVNDRVKFTPSFRHHLPMAK
jgi:hypothetical protein